MKIQEKEMEATARVFMTAFKALPEKTREIFLEKLAGDKDLMEDLMDVALIESRRDEPSIPLDEALAEIK